MGIEILNEKNEETVKRIHLLVTNLCTRNCPNCCNKCYSLNDIPVVTEEELSKAEWLFLTGGEPFAFTNPSAIACYYKEKYPNIKNVIVYGNASDFNEYLFVKKGSMKGIDGVSLSVKDLNDVMSWRNIHQRRYDVNWITNFGSLENNIVYNFTSSPLDPLSSFPIVKREWVDYKEWKPSPDSIFRRAF